MNRWMSAVGIACALVVGACSKSGSDALAATSASSASLSSAPARGGAAAGGSAAAAGGGGGGGGECGAGHVMSRLTIGPRCMKTCAKTADCGKGWDCASAPLAKGGMAKVCFDQNDN